MSTYQAPAIHPDTGEIELALFIDDHFGRRRYGVKFEDGKIFPETAVQLPQDEPRPATSHNEEKEG